MGMESVNILALTKEVKICRQSEYWYLDGNSKLSLLVLKKFLLNFKIRKVSENNWILNKCIDIKIYEKNGYFQGLEFRICLSYLKKGIDICYNFLQIFNKEILETDIYIINKKIIAEDSFQLYKIVNEIYKDKIDIFEKCYGNIEIKTTSSKFYSKIKWYKLYYKIMDK